MNKSAGVFGGTGRRGGFFSNSGLGLQHAHSTLTTHHTLIRTFGSTTAYCMHHWTHGLARLGQLTAWAFETKETACVLASKTYTLVLPWGLPFSQVCITFHLWTQAQLLFIHYLLARSSVKSSICIISILFPFLDSVHTADFLPRRYLFPSFALYLNKIYLFPSLNSATCT